MLNLVYTGNGFIKNVRKESGAYFYVFCDTVLDVKWSCCVYYVWEAGGGGC
jgi:hypothetical protein